MIKESVAGLGALLTVVAVAGCDPLPQTEVRNRTPEPLAIYVAGRVVGVDPDESVVVRPGKQVQLMAREGPLRVTRGACEYAYTPPERNISFEIGAVNQLEVGSDMRLYIRRLIHPDGKLVKVLVSDQPAGWPVVAATKTCR